MRTTLSIDDDVLRAAKQRSETTGESLGRTISRLARNSLQETTRESSHRNGVRLLPTHPEAHAVTLEDVNRLRDELV